jgi:hypothetical protein
VSKTNVALLCWMLALLPSAGSYADMVKDIYIASVPVENQSAKVLVSASRQALAEVIVKVSGSKTVLRNPVIATALNKARNQVQQYSYVRIRTPERGLAARIEFDGGYINDLVIRAGIPLWTANRPLVLAWVVVEDEQGRHFINWDTSAEQAQQLADEFSRRGVPVQLPVFDLVDTAAVSVESAWALDPNVIRAASARYNVQNIVAARLASSSDGKLQGEWRYFYQGDQSKRSVTVPDLQVFLRDGVNIVAGAMSARYAVAPTKGEAGGLRMSVSGVSDYAQFAAIISWMEDLELVERVLLEQVQGDRIELRLQAQANATQLATIIELNEQLLPMPVAMPGSASTAQLNYQWRK